MVLLTIREKGHLEKTIFNTFFEFKNINEIEINYPVWKWSVPSDTQCPN